MGTSKTDGLRRIQLCMWERLKNTKSYDQMGYDTGTRGQRSNPPFLTHTHKCSLLFSFSAAWELAVGLKTLHQKEARGEKESRKMDWETVGRKQTSAAVRRWREKVVQGVRQETCVSACECVWTRGCRGKRRIVCFTPQVHCIFSGKAAGKQSASLLS